MAQALPSKWVDALSLGRRKAPELYSAGDAIKLGPHAESIRFALDELGLAAVFCIEGAPTIGFLNEPNVTLDRIDAVHRVLWNQGLMSLLLVIGDDELTAYSLVQRPFKREEGTSKQDPRLITTLSLLGHALTLRELIDSTESGRFWFENDSFFDLSQRVDSVLLDNLLHAFRKLKDDLGSDGAQALLMQTMFIAYLEDRKIITPDVFQDASNGSHSKFEEILAAKSAKPFEKLFVWLKEAFNGDVFNAPCAFDLGSKLPPKLKTEHLRVLGPFRHGREEIGSGQLRFFGYDFQHMPIALISAVYDRFLKEEAEKKNSDGAFYTPMFLADVVVNQVWDELNDEQRSKGIFYDPACGSGIFLVRVFQRLVAHHCRTRKKRYATWNELTSIALRLHGGDVNTAAVRVATFSLYIALLEQSNPPDLPALIKKGKLLPSLYRVTLRVEDFFTTADEARYDAIIGNPPWKGRAGVVTTAQQWAKAQNLPDPGKDIAWGFVWKSLNSVKPDGLIGLLLPAMGVLHNTSGEAARKLLLRKASVRRIINLSDLCFQLFDGAQRPTAFVLYQNGQDDGTPYRFEYWVPKADLNLRLKRIMTLSRSDRLRLRSDQVESDPSIFKRRLWTRSPDERLLQYLRSVPALNIFICEYKTLRKGEFDRAFTWAIGQGFQPANPEKTGQPEYRTTTSDFVTGYPYLAAESFSAIALPAIEEKPWHTKSVRRAGFSEGFIGPHILVPQGVERSIGRVRAAYTEQSLAFEHSLQAIAFPASESRTAKLLTAVLNSSLAAWFYFHDSANFGADRAKVHQNELLKLPFSAPESMPDPERATAAAEKIVRLVDREIKQANDLLRQHGNVLEEIDGLVYEYYALDEHDIALIDDTFKHIIPAMQPRRSAGMQKIWDSSRLEHRSAYAATLCDALKPWFRKPVGASLTAISADIAVLRLTLDSSDQTDEAYSENASTDFEIFLQTIHANLPAPLPGNVQLVPDLRFVIGHDMYLIKPIQLRHWLRSTALADAEQIAAEFSAVVARNSKLDAQNAGR
ncbi:MAG: N-6 DNA methylase [Minwuia sp.]|nr:N-6 DNA methylase [Minwuia sp.]